MEIPESTPRDRRQLNVRLSKATFENLESLGVVRTLADGKTTPDYRRSVEYAARIASLWKRGELPRCRG